MRKYPLNIQAANTCGRRGAGAETGARNQHVVAAFFLLHILGDGDFYETLPSIWKNVAPALVLYIFFYFLSFFA